MQLDLFISQAFAPCREAERVWQAVATEAGVALAIIDINSTAGHDLADKLRITVVPAVAIDGRLAAVGVQTEEEARALVPAGGAAR